MQIRGIKKFLSDWRQNSSESRE
uniref:Uncharacterized protein n=1 Tax=Triticum urartu TaxID=4572 RepID=A0A8R7TGH2_TRIUA